MLCSRLSICTICHCCHCDAPPPPPPPPPLPPPPPPTLPPLSILCLNLLLFCFLMATLLFLYAIMSVILGLGRFSTLILSGGEGVVLNFLQELSSSTGLYMLESPCPCVWTLSGRYLSNCSTFCNQTWYGGASS